jgi:hypothetical protein
MCDNCICTHLLDHLPYYVQQLRAPFLTVFAFCKIQIRVSKRKIQHLTVPGSRTKKKPQSVN